MVSTNTEAEGGYLVIENKSVDGSDSEQCSDDENTRCHGDVTRCHGDDDENPGIELQCLKVQNTGDIETLEETTSFVDDSVAHKPEEQDGFTTVLLPGHTDDQEASVLSEICSASSDPCPSSSSSRNSQADSDSSQDLRLKPKKITISFDLQSSSSDSSVGNSDSVDNSDIEGIPRKRRLQRTTHSLQDSTLASYHSSEESLSSFEGSSASDFNKISQKSTVSSGWSSSKSTDIESGGVRDWKRKNRNTGVAGFVELLGLGRLWFKSPKNSRFDEAAEKRKLAEAEKNKTTVAEIYPWITEEENRVLRETKESFKRKAGILPISEDIEIIKLC